MDNAGDIGDSEEIVGITKFLAYLEIVSARGESPQKCQEGSTCQKLIKNLSYKILSKKYLGIFLCIFKKKNFLDLIWFFF